MKCRFCKRDGLPDDAVWCCWCGERVKKERKAEIKIPEPRLMPSGRWLMTLRKEGISFTCDTAEECRTKARAIRMELIEAEKHPDRITLGKLLEEYISSKDNVLSPSTIAGYDKIRQLRFTAYINTPVADIPWQRMINAEPGAPKTIYNAWGLVAAALKANSLPVPNITLPQIVPFDSRFLQPEQIPPFVEMVSQTRIAIPALLALHSLRVSEIAALTWDDIERDALWEGKKCDIIHVRGAIVRDRNGVIVRKNTNKNTSSRRDIPIFIPLLKKLISSSEDVVPCKHRPASLTPALYRVCDNHAFERINMHALRHSFVSLAYSLGLNELTTMRLGGWSDFDAMRNRYTHLATRDLVEAADTLTKFYSGVSA